MAGNKNIDYSVQLSDIGAPVKGNAGELNIAAAGSQAKGIEIQGKANADAITFLGTNALAAGKGYLEAGAEKEIKDSLDKLQGFGNTAKASAGAANAPLAQKADGTYGFLEPTTGMVSAEFPSTGPNDVRQEFTNNLERLQLAVTQGMLGQDEVISRIAATVKKYSAIAPGWASEFRKIGAEQTGISNVDVYGIHKALTQQSAASKAQEHIQAKNLELLTGFAKSRGILSMQEAASPKWEFERNRFQQEALEKVFVERNENRMKSEKMDQDTTDKVGHQIFNGLLNQEVNGALTAKNEKGEAVPYAERMRELVLLNNSTSPEDRTKAQSLGNILSGDLIAMRDRVGAAIRTMASADDGRKNVISSTKAKEMQEQLKGLVTDIADSVKTVEGRNMFAAVYDTANKTKEGLLTAFYLAHPVLLGIKDTGVSAPLYQAYITTMGPNGDTTEFSRRFGTEVTSAFDALRKGGGFASVSNANTAIVKGQDVSLATLRTTDPKAYTAVVANAVLFMTEIPKKSEPSAEDKTAYVNYLKKFEKVNYDVANDVSTMTNILSVPQLDKFLGTLSPQQRIGALSPIVASSTYAMQNMTNQLQTLVAGANVATNKDPAFPNATLRLEVSPETGLVNVVMGGEYRREANAPYAYNGAVTEGLSFSTRTANAGFRDKDASQGSSLFAQNYKRAVEIAGKLNGVMDVYTLAAKGMNPDLPLTVKDVREKVLRGQDPAPGLMKDLHTATPKDSDNTQSTNGVDITKMVNVIKVHGEGNNPGLSPKGALGFHQFTEATGRKYGLKIDAVAGIDERKDPVKSEQAAVKFLTDLSKQYNGDIAKMAAGYNAGEPAVNEAIKKANALGIPEQWLGVLAGMPGGGQHSYARETLPYVKRVVTAYNKQESATTEAQVSPKQYDYGTRTDGTKKHQGYFGEIPAFDGVSTELSVSIGFDGKEHLVPSLVPTLTKSEVKHLVDGGKLTPAIEDKVVAHARKRIKEGKSPFAGPNDKPIQWDKK
ncbi:LT_GEWL domain containing protein [uncultured Caudovirales phage]|uniref:LT_GEWL domain containing protein n=1 Tax=uncultured Caudovirales phage TaxID=2100421 RepID=A0A6J5PDQ8_9CAUD|nr:LT_GEWL domain containing protein [uncultured Caudovirales phage]CAB4182578.1 LT_GEWL domain containing protein [uncultured Caudovirales phage]CAB4197941.1 LT_GEWL domain containing protein [uncultured Caudovirales phage]CAB4212433.1 LT_GEWL domain containing protein [uncultured Caudovirales phage]CAB5227107.1 LT_GEWL domain containing protein [uncultured Caudovirales phage]